MRLEYQIFFTIIFLVMIIGCKESAQTDLDKSEKARFGKEIILQSLEGVTLKRVNDQRPPGYLKTL